MEFGEPARAVYREKKGPFSTKTPCEDLGSGKRVLALRSMHPHLGSFIVGLLASRNLVRKKGSFGKRVFSEKSFFSRDSREFRDSREPQTVENKGESDHFLEVLENLEVLEILGIPPVKRPLS